MTEWVDWSDAEAATTWDAALMKFADYNLYQSFGWGEFKRRRRWDVRRGNLVVDGVQVGMAQCLVREVRVARTKIVWMPGGPAGDLSVGCRIAEAFRRRHRGWLLYFRTNVLSDATAEDARLLGEAGWRRAAHPLSRPLTFHVDLAAGDAALRHGLSSNWRHNLKRGEQRGGVVCEWDPGAPLEPVHAVYRDTARLKGIDETLGLDDLYAMREVFGDRFRLVAALDDGGEPCAIRGFARVGARAHDLVASVSDSGRKRYSSYPVTWRLLQLAREDGVDLYDMSGADPDGAAGVFNFKKGLGGRAVDMVGEWEWATGRAIRWVADRVLSHRAVTACKD